MLAKNSINLKAQKVKKEYEDKFYDYITQCSIIFPIPVLTIIKFKLIIFDH